MTIKTKSDLRNLTVKQLRKINSDNELGITGAWNMRKDDLVEEIFDYICEAWNLEDDETVIEVEEPKKKGKRSIPVILLKDGEVIGEFESLLQASQFLEKQIGGKLYEGIKGLARGTWTPKRGRLKGYEVKRAE